MLANDRHRANIERAFAEYLESNYFFGHVYPGQFYNFCSNHEAYRQINNTLCNRVQLSIQDLAMRTNTSFRKVGPRKSTCEKAKYYLAICLESVAKGSNINRWLREKLGDGYGDCSKYVPLRTVKYLHEIGFSVEDLPPLARDDIKNFLKKMQDEQFTKVSDYIAHMRDVVIPLEQRETAESDEPGFLYCFISNLKAQTKGFCVVKVGRTKKAIERVLSHKSVMSEHQIVYLTHTSASLANEKKLIEHFEKSSLSRPFYDPRTKRKSSEMFELPALYVPKIFSDIISGLQSL